MKLVVHAAVLLISSASITLNLGTVEAIVKQLTRRDAMLRFESQKSNAAWKEGQSWNRQDGNLMMV
jgi:hypothetical protein